MGGAVLPEQEIIIEQRISVDIEIADEIRWLNKMGVRTEGSCSGHGQLAPSAVITPSDVGYALQLGYVPVFDNDIWVIELRGEEFDCRFPIELDDGRVAMCWEAQRQPYADCVFSAGLVDDIEPDILYLRLQRNGEEPVTLFFRPDEMQAICWLCNGALWALSMMGRARIVVSDGR